MELRHVICTTRQPNPNDSKDLGNCEEVFFRIENGDTLVLCSPGGSMMRSGEGLPITQRLLYDDVPERIAGRLFMKNWRSTREDRNDFGRRIQYTEPYGGY